MAIRTLKLPMKKGLVIVKESTELPLKENVMLHTNEYIFYCNSTTFDKLVRMKSQDDSNKADKDLTDFFLNEVRMVSILAECFDFDGAINDLKTNLVLGKEDRQEGNYAAHWEKESNQQIINNFRKAYAGQLENINRLQIYTDPDGNYKAMVDIQNETIEFIQFDDKFSPLKERNVMVENININRRPMYIIHKLLGLIMMVRDRTEQPNWGA